MDIPIVLIHKTEHPCLEFSLRAARQHHDDVTLITDITSGRYDRWARIADIHQLGNEATRRFAEVYRHMSTNSHEFEYICIERWFLLLEYMQRNGLDAVIYIDSDVIVYENLTKVVRQHYASSDICLCTSDQTYDDMRWVSSGHTLYATRKALELLCGFILETYTDNMKELLIKWDWHERHQVPGGINDMTLLYLFQKNTSLRCGNFLKVVNGTFCFDTQINSGWNEYPDEYEEQYSFILGRTIKKISFRGHQPYGYNRKLGKEIRFVTLHCQSDAKRIMPLLMKDKRPVKTILSDNAQTLRMAYYAVRREISKKIRG